MRKMFLAVSIAAVGILLVSVPLVAHHGAAALDTGKEVTLKGTVTGKAGRTQATKVAMGTEGVHSVVNKLTIGPKLKG